MSSEVIVILFEFVAMVLALTVHEAAHAWTASRLGDQTARMLGRVTLNPTKHVDPLGTVLIPLIAMFYHAPLIGWAKPTPVQPRNFVHYKRDSNLVTVAGPVSNLLLAFVCVFLLVVVKHAAPEGLRHIAVAQMMVDGAPGLGVPTGILAPLVLLLYCGLVINSLLFVFNLIPLPPLDGSRILDMYLPPRLSIAYGKIGYFSMIILMGLAYYGFIGMLFAPVFNFFVRILNWA